MLLSIRDAHHRLADTEHMDVYDLLILLAAAALAVRSLCELSAAHERGFRRKLARRIAAERVAADAVAEPPPVSNDAARDRLAA